MSDKLDDFMKKNIPETSGSLRKLELPGRKNWMATFAVSGALAASLVLTVVSRTGNFEIASDDVEMSFEDEFPEEYQEVENILEEI